MRIFAVPWYWSTGDARKGANFNQLVEIVNKSLSHSDHLFWEIVVPAAPSGAKVRSYTSVPGGIFEDSSRHSPPRLRYWMEPFGQMNPRVDSWGYPLSFLEKLSPYKDLLWADVIYCQNPFLAPQMFRAVHETLPQTQAKIPFIINSEDTHIDEAAMYSDLGVDKMIQRMEWFGMTFGHTIFHQPWNRLRTIAEAKRWLSVSAVKDLDENSSVIFYPVDTELIDNMRASFEKQRRERRGKVVNLFYGGRWMGKKKVDKVVQIYERMRRNYPVNLVMVTPEQTGYEDYNPFYGCNRAEFLQKLGLGDVQLVLADYENAGTGYWEIAYSGMLTVFLRREWHRYLWDDTGYPFVANSIDEAEKMLAYIISNYDEAMTYLPILLDSIGKQLGSVGIAQRFLDVSKDLVERNRSDIWTKYHKGAWGTLVGDALKILPRRFGMSDVWNAMQMSSDRGIDIGKRKDLVNGRIVRDLLISGYECVDLCTEPEPLFEKK